MCKRISQSSQTYGSIFDRTLRIIGERSDMSCRKDACKKSGTHLIAEKGNESRDDRSDSTSRNNRTASRKKSDGSPECGRSSLRHILARNAQHLKVVDNFSH